MHKRFRALKARFIVPALAVTLGAAAATPPAAEDFSAARSDDITIGVISESTGPGASYGLGIVRGAEMAVRDINGAGGIRGRPVRLVVGDGRSNPAGSTIAMRHLVAAGVDIVVGGWGSPQVLANLEIAEQSATPYVVVGATHPRITSPRNRWTFRVIQTDTVMADQLASLAVGAMRLRRIAVINDSNAYGAGNREVFVAALRRAGIEPAEVQSYESADTDFSAQLTRIRAAAPDAIAVFGTLPAAPLIMNQVREMGLTTRFLGTGGLANDSLIVAAPRASDGTVLMTFFDEQADAQAKAWAERFRREFAGQDGTASPVLAAWEYRAVHDIAAPCLQSAGHDRVGVRDCIRRWRGRMFGIAEEAYFDASGQLVQPPVVVEVRGGRFDTFRGGR